MRKGDWSSFDCIRVFEWNMYVNLGLTASERENVVDLVLSVKNGIHGLI